MLAAYNAGPGRYEAFLVGGRALPAETRAYVARLAPRVGTDGTLRFASGLPAMRKPTLFVALHRPPSAPDPAPPTPTRTPMFAGAATLFAPLTPRELIP